jgi:methyl-accepting chemotaxis protein
MKDKRKRYLINKVVQLKYAYLSIWLMLLGILITNIITFETVSSSLLKILEQPEPFLNIVGVVQEMKSLLFVRIGIALIILIILGIIFKIYFIHRLVGPMYRFRNDLLKISSGRLPPRIKFRKKDYFKEITDAYNDVIIFLENDRVRQSKFLENMRSSLNCIKNSINDKDAISNCIKQMQSTINGFEERFAIKQEMVK